MRRAVALLLVPLLMLAACGDDDEGAVERADGGDTTEVTEADEPVDDGIDESALEVVVGPSGIEVSSEGAPRSFAFGEPGDAAVQAISDALGEPSDAGEVPECPAGPADAVTWDDQLQVVLQDGNLVGWTLPEGSTLQHEDGIGIGSTLEDVGDRYPDVTVDDASTLGVELYAESAGLSGLLSEHAPTGVVTVLWSGIVCTFR